MRKTALIIISILLIAEVVYADQMIWVKNRSTPVDLTYFEYLDTSQSSQIDGIRYHADNDYLIINFKKARINYQYCSVPEDVWLYMKNLSDHGSYDRAYDSRLKGKYACQLGFVPSIYDDSQFKQAGENRIRTLP